MSLKLNLCVYVCACTSLYELGEYRCLWKPEEGLPSPELELKAIVRLQMWVLGAKLGSTQEQPMPLISEPPLHPPTLTEQSVFE